MEKQSRLFLLILGTFFVLHNIVAQEGFNKIQSLHITETDNETLITLTATEKINYTIFKKDKPPGVILDFGNADLEDLKSSYSVDNGIIKNIKVITEVEGGLPISRIEINMEKLMEFSTTQEENKLLIAVSKITELTFQEEQPVPEESEQGLVGELAEELAPPEEGGLPEGIGEEHGAEIAAPEVFGIPGEMAETGELPAPEGEAEIALGEPLPEEEETIPGEELTEEVETIEEGDISIEEEPSLAEEELPVGEEIPETAPQVEAGAIAVAEVPLESTAETPTEGESIETVIEKSETLAQPLVPEVTAVPQEEKTTVIAQAPPPIETTPPPPPVPQKEEKKAWIKGNRIITAEKIRFGPNEAVLPIEYESIVKEIAKLLNENPRIKIRIEGYTDNAGDEEYNRALSEYRAIWLKLLLERFGVHSNRIQVAGMGESNPIASNDTERGREKNRRVEFIITQK